MQGKPSAQLAPSLCAASKLPVFSISTAPADSTEQQAPLPARLFDEGSLSLAALEACNFAGKAVCTLLRYVPRSMLPPLLVSILAALSLSVCRLPCAGKAAAASAKEANPDFALSDVQL